MNRFAALLIAGLVLAAGFARADSWATLDKAKITMAGAAFGKILANEVWQESMIGDAPFPTAEAQYTREAIGANRAGYYTAAEIRLFVLAADQSYETSYDAILARYNAAKAGQ